MESYLAIDLGGTNLRSAIIGFEDSPKINEIQKEFTKVKTWKDPIDQIVKIYRTHLEANREIKAIGICSPGIIDSKNGIVKIAFNLPDWENLKLSKIIAEETNKEVSVINDVRAAALGEWFLRDRNHMGLFAYLNIGTGVSSAILHRGKIVAGNFNFGGEIGHICLDPHGVFCHECKKNYGCLATYASGTGIIKYVEKNLNDDSYLRNKNISPELIYRAARESQDPIALAAYEEAAIAIARAILIIFYMLDPDVLFIGGGVMKASDILVPIINSYVNNNDVFSEIRNIQERIFTTKNGDISGLVGAAVYAMNQSGGE